MNNSSSVSAEPATLPILITAAAWKIVAETLHRYAPGREVWAYGSRARRERVKRHSDLDLAIDGPPASLLELSEIREAFDQSALPFKVDVDYAESFDPAFRSRIETDKVIVQVAD